MAWTLPAFSKKKVNWAGVILSKDEVDFLDFSHAILIINNWRSSHSFPLNTFQMTLRRKARSIDSDFIVAQRIKRLSSIESKLRRFRTMTLSQMQDVGGCRAILSDCDRVRELAEMYQKSDLKHRLHTVDDYLVSPKISGYRGIHIIYQYFSDKNDVFNSLKIEMQLRSQLQHSWATAVEIAGTFTKQALKSSQGDLDWQRFFALVSSAFAAQEDTAPVSGAPTSYRELKSELQGLDEKLDALRKLRTFGIAPEMMTSKSQDGAHFFLLELFPTEGRLEVTGFRKNESDAANEAYTEAEKRRSNPADSDIVLVSVDAIEALSKAYPNYYLDTSLFADSAEAFIWG